MNTTYLAIEAFLTLFVIYTMIHSRNWWESIAHEGKQLLAIVSLIVAIILFPVSFIPGTGEPNFTVKDAYSQKVGNEIVVQVDGWPTKITSDIKFIDVPLQIKRIEPRNSWGIDCNNSYSYEVQVNKPSIKTELQ